jgi:membrane peptidoglycan carboxypeptidase
VTEGETREVFAADCSVLAYLFGEENRTIISSADISPLLKYALVAIEDKRLYQHNRRSEVLAAMREQGYITREQYDEAYDTPIKLAPYSPSTDA